MKRYIIIIALLLGFCACGTKYHPTTAQTLESIHPYDWDCIEEGCIPLDFESIYYVDTLNMVIYYDNYDQFDMDNEYDKNPDNINEDSNLILHISRDNMIELFNRMLQWLDVVDESYDYSHYIESMFGIKEIDNEYYVVYLGLQ